MNSIGHDNIDALLPAIVVVGYKRTHTISRLLASLNNCDYPTGNINLIISIDFSDSAEVYEIALKFIWKHGKKSIIRHDEKLGLRKHVISCGDLTNIYGAVIILEDDLLVSKYFYLYAVEVLSHYSDSNEIAGFALYSHNWNGYAHRNFTPLCNGYSVYCGQFSITWGQMWTKNQWNKFKDWIIEHNFEVNPTIELPHQIHKWPNTSWGKLFVAFIVSTNTYYLIPYISYTTNFSDIGTNNVILDSTHQVILAQSPPLPYYGNVSDLIKYDVYFENANLGAYLNISPKDLCVDLYGQKTNYNDYKYILTTKKANLKPVKNFGISLRPHEINIIENIDGNDIGLYVVDKDSWKKLRMKINNNISSYEIRSVPIKMLLKYVFLLIKNKIVRLIKVCFSKK